MASAAGSSVSSAVRSAVVRGAAIARPHSNARSSQRDGSHPVPLEAGSATMRSTAAAIGQPSDCASSIASRMGSFWASVQSAAEESVRSAGQRAGGTLGASSGGASSTARDASVVNPATGGNGSGVVWG